MSIFIKIGSKRINIANVATYEPSAFARGGTLFTFIDGETLIVEGTEPDGVDALITKAQTKKSIEVQL